MHSLYTKISKCSYYNLHLEGFNKNKTLTNKSSFIILTQEIIIHILVSNNLYFAQTFSILSYT